jgi:hypothetical protein
MIVEFKYEIGQTVTIKALKVEGIVNAVTKDKDGLCYAIIYWWDGKRNREWLLEIELT